MRQILITLLQHKFSVFLLTFFIPSMMEGQLRLKSGHPIYAEMDRFGQIYTTVNSVNATDIELLSKIVGKTRLEIHEYHTATSQKSKIKTGITLIPVNKGYIISNPNFKKWKHSYLVVKYKVKKGETLYTIAKSYFDTSEDFLLALNNKTTHELKSGEELIIGWLLMQRENLQNEQPVIARNKEAGKPSNVKNEQDISSNRVIQKEMPLKHEEEEISPKVKEDESVSVEKSVIGIWDKNGSASENYYALFNDLYPGSMMDVYNPMLRRIIKVKVIGKIPQGTYASEVELILNPAATRALGILDTRFKARVKYQIKE